MTPQDELSPPELRPRRWFHFRYSLLTLLLVITSLCLILGFTQRDHGVEVEAVIEIDSRQPMILPDESNRFDSQEFAAYRETQRQLMKSSMVLDKVVAMPGIATLPILADKADRSDWLSQHVKIEFVGGSDLLAVRLRGARGQSNDLMTILNAIVVEYLKLQTSGESQRNENVLKVLVMEREMLDTYLQNCIRRLNDLKAKKDEDDSQVRLAELELQVITDRWREVSKKIGIIQTNRHAPARVRLLQRAKARDF